MSNLIAPPVTDPSQVTRAYRGYVLALLTLVYVVNFVDRQVLAVLIEPIKRDLQLTDSQLGFLSGMAFAFFYVTFGVPLARLADRRSRRNLMAACMAAWSIMTALCGLAGNFMQLLAARIGVAIGEAGCVAPAHSVISDYFRAQDRPAAIGIFSTGASLGIFVGLLLGGWLSETYGWRETLVLIGLPGVLVSLLMLATLREPLRGMSGARAPAATAGAGNWRSLLQVRALLWIAIATGLQSMVVYGTASWLPAFYMRVHGMHASQVGTILAIVNGLVAGAGAAIGAYVAGRLARNDVRWLLWLPAVATLVATPLYFLAVNVDDAQLSYLALTPAAFLGAMYAPCALAATHGLTGDALRATGIALVLLVSNFIGIGGGALLVGFVSDLFIAADPTHSLRYGLEVVLIANLLAFAGYLLASRSLLRDWKD